MRCYLLLFILLAMPFTLPAKAADSFVSGFSDLPLMPGLAQELDDSTNFETLDGDIAMAEAGGAVSATAFQQWYQDTLPAMGWQAAAPLIYRRDGQELRLEIMTSRPLRVRFFLQPQPKETP